MLRILASFATSIDGSISDFSGRWKPLCKYELNRYLNTIDESDAIIVGSNTVKHSGLSFEPRIIKKIFIKVLIDPRLEVPFTHSFYNKVSEFTKIIVFYSGDYKPNRKEAIIATDNVSLIQYKGKYLSSKIIINELAKYNVKRTALIGGGKILALFLKDNAIDTLRVTVSPLILGKGTPLVNRVIDRFPGKKLKLYKIDMCPCGQEVVLYYSVE